MRLKMVRWLSLIGFSALILSGAYAFSDSCFADAYECDGGCFVSAPVVQCTSAPNYASCLGYDENGNLIAVQIGRCRPVIPGPGC